jgi:hypothetical protein
VITAHDGGRQARLPSFYVVEGFQVDYRSSDDKYIAAELRPSERSIAWSNGTIDPDLAAALPQRYIPVMPQAWVSTPCGRPGLPRS